jgi:hypothetical protein
VAIDLSDLDYHPVANDAEIDGFATEFAESLEVGKGDPDQVALGVSAQGVANERLAGQEAAIGVSTEEPVSLERAQDS